MLWCRVVGNARYFSSCIMDIMKQCSLGESLGKNMQMGFRFAEGDTYPNGDADVFYETSRRGWLFKIKFGNDAFYSNSPGEVLSLMNQNQWVYYSWELNSIKRLIVHVSQKEVVDWVKEGF